MFIFAGIVKVLHLLLCAVVVLGVLFSDQKSGGLSGIMGGMSQSMRGVKGMDEGMRKFVTGAAIALILTSVFLGITGI